MEEDEKLEEDVSEVTTIPGIAPPSVAIETEIEPPVSKKHFVSMNNQSVKTAEHYVRMVGMGSINACMLVGKPGLGKGQPLNATVWTPTGPVKISTLKIGDIVLTPDGKTAKVQGIFPQGVKKCYNIKFVGGQEVICDNSHLWEIFHQNPSMRNGKILSTEDLIKYIKGRYKRVWTRVTKPVVFKEQTVVIAPYILGYLLGNGCLTRGVGFSTQDAEVIENISGKLASGYKVTYRSKYDWAIVKDAPKNTTIPNEYYAELKRLKLNVKSQFKHIPKEYLYNSIEVRTELLKGLMDSDGYVNPNQGAVRYDSSSKRLIEDVETLICSLGGTVRRTKRKGISYKNGIKKRCLDSYGLTIQVEDSRKIFTVARKIAKAYKREKYGLKKFIKNIVPVKNQETVCIMIDHPDHLYLTDGFIVTHNTFLVRHTLNDMGVKFSMYGGHITLAEIYEYIWEHQSDLIFFDDVSQVINKVEIMEMLKQALNIDADSRVLNYRSKGVLSKGCPDHFTFHGRMIFAFNTMDLQNPNVKAIIDRAPKIELNYSRKEILEAMYQIAKGDGGGLLEWEKMIVTKEIEDWTDSTMDISLRKQQLAFQIYASFKKLNGEGNDIWQNEVHNLFGKKRVSWIEELLIDCVGIGGRMKRVDLVKEIAMRRNLSPRSAQRMIGEYIEMEVIFHNKLKGGFISLKKFDDPKEVFDDDS